MVESGQEKAGLEKIKSANKVFEMTGMDVLEALCRIHLGVHFFRNNRLKDAEYHFLKGYGASKRCGSDYLRSYIDANMADVHIMKGEMREAEKRLDRAESGFIKFNDLYGLSGVYFNRALFYLSLGDEEKAEVEMTRSLNVAYPLPNPMIRNEWKRVYEERRKKNIR
ncbi:MAG: hypothetical protein JXA22_04895 [Candidatus Thermoplasmatota archaeon]|nr:hypothetical protein [Candidatus Thermoplasmatota archaeon]